MTPDFKQIAHELAAKHADNWDEDSDGNQHQFVSEVTLREDIIEQLRLAWNARGAADIAKLRTMWPFVENIEQALCSLDVTPN